MDYNFNSIGYFQFNNLIQSRVPMLLFLLEGVEVKQWYNSFINMHLDIITTRCEVSEIPSIIAEKKLPKDYAIVVLDKNGNVAEKVVQELEKDHTNIYYVNGGVLSLEAERQ